MKRILVPTDFTQGSLNAYKYALQLANQLGTKITLYHVFDQDKDNSYMPKSLVEAIREKDEEGALSALEGYGYAVQQHLNLDIDSTYILEEGRPVKSIVAYADFMEADLIIMGTWWAKGASGMVESWLGNAGTKVIEQTNRPVLLIPEDVSFKDIRHIAYATNFREKEQRVPEELIELSNTFNLDVSVVHVQRTDSVYDPVQFAFLREMYRLEMDNFNIYFYTLNDKNVVEGLNTFINKEEVDILAMLYHGRLTVFDRVLGPGIPQQMAFHSRIPFLVLHQEYKIKDS